MFAHRGIKARFEDFVDDPPSLAESQPLPAPDAAGGIDGVVVRPLRPLADARGRLVALLPPFGDADPPVVHVYRVFAAPGSVRAWVFHRRQSDRLAFSDGDFRVALIDLRPGSPTRGLTQVVPAGAADPCLIVIPPFVVHGVKNAGAEEASFVNLPTRAYDPVQPDKARLPYGDPRLPFRFD